ncbi:hypothetical protein CVS40_4844 [Lucilia cuprina]|nr:hypothetical protein CVS40_4844 [Lucilia cuprina]
MIFYLKHVEIVFFRTRFAYATLLCVSNKQIQLLDTTQKELRGARKNSHIFKEMRLELVSLGGIQVTPEEIKTKIHNLTGLFHTNFKFVHSTPQYTPKEKNAVGPSGGSPSTWNLYPKVHSILGPFKINNLEAVVEENITDSSRSFEGMESEEYTNFEILTEEFASGVSSAYSPPLMSSSSDNDSPSTSETVRSAKIEDLEKEEEEEKANQKIWEEKMYNLEVQKTNMLEKLTNDNEELKTVIINYLSNKN